MNEWLFFLLLVVIGTAAAMSFAFTLLTERFRSTTYLTKLLGDQYGFIRTKYCITHALANDGSSHAKYTEAFQATNAELSGIEHYSTITTEPSHLVQNFRLEVVGKTESGIEIVPKLTLVTPTKLFFQLLFSPPLPRGKHLEYSYDVYTPPGMFMLSPEELQKRKLPYDFVSMKIAYPTSRLEMEVIFPSTLFIERLEYDVWMGDARLRLKKEFQRLENDRAMKTERRGENLVARLVVDYPILDLKYAITWIPVQMSRPQD